MEKPMMERLRSRLDRGDAAWPRTPGESPDDHGAGRPGPAATSRLRRRRIPFNLPRPLQLLTTRSGFLAVAALILTANWLVVGSHTRRLDAATRRWGHTRRVAVARNALPAGNPLSTRNVELRAIPTALLPSGVLDARRFGKGAGYRLRIDVGAGEILTDRHIGRSTSALAAQVPSGSRAIAIPFGAGDAQAVPTLHRGDRVDLLAPASPEDASAVVATGAPVPLGTLVADALVISARRTAGGLPTHAPDVVTVVVPNADAAAVATAITAGRLIVVLRGA
ncbi:MAG: RcpC/CpaB family pilus assembly protein [Microthrixaceae bacterium]